MIISQFAVPTVIKFPLCTMGGFLANMMTSLSQTVIVSISHSSRDHMTGILQTAALSATPLGKTATTQKLLIITITDWADTLSPGSQPPKDNDCIVLINNL